MSAGVARLTSSLADATITITPVPEPSTFALALGAVGLLPEARHSCAGRPSPLLRKDELSDRHGPGGAGHTLIMQMGTALVGASSRVRNYV